MTDKIELWVSECPMCERKVYYDYDDKCKDGIHCPYCDDYIDYENKKRAHIETIIDKYDQSQHDLKVAREALEKYAPYCKTCRYIKCIKEECNGYIAKQALAKLDKPTTKDIIRISEECGLYDEKDGEQ